MPDDIRRGSKNLATRLILSNLRIGAAFQVLPRIARVVPGSEAERSGKFQVGQKVTSIELITPQEPSADAKPEDGEKKTDSSEILKLAELDEKYAGTGTIEDINWAWAFANLQLKPSAIVRIHVEDTKEKTSVELKNWKPPKTGIAGFEGISGWQPAADLQKAESFSDAVHLSVRKTKNTTIEIYKTLRSLIRGDLPPSSLSGPLQIANIGYRVAQRGLSDLLVFLGFLSINLAVINFLPIPVLDGGHMVFLIWKGLLAVNLTPKSSLGSWHGLPVHHHTLCVRDVSGRVREQTGLRRLVTPASVRMSF